MVVILYSCIYCPWAARTWIALKEANIKYDLVEIDLSQPRESWYLERINPLGKVPALQLEDGTVLCESAVCSEYIADVSGRLLPEGALQRSKIKFFLERFATFPSVLISVFSASPDKQREVFRSAISNVNELLKSHLHGGPFLLGSQEYTLAEVNCVPFLARFRMLGEAGLYPDSIYQEVLNDPEYALFHEWVSNCLKRRSHMEIWDQEVNLRKAKKRVQELRALKNASNSDYIYLKDLQLIGNVGLSSFSFSDRKFPLKLSMDVRTEPVEPGKDDYVVSYGDVAREVTSVVENGTFESLETVARAILETPSSRARWQRLVLSKEGGLLRTDGEKIEVNSDGLAKYTISGIRVGCIIGVYDHERLQKQDVVINLSLLKSNWTSASNQQISFIVEDETRTGLQSLITIVERSTFKTVEAMAEQLCEAALAQYRRADSIETWISKPSALVFAKHSGVCITRGRA